MNRVLALLAQFDVLLGRLDGQLSLCAWSRSASRSRNNLKVSMRARPTSSASLRSSGGIDIGTKSPWPSASQGRRDLNRLSDAPGNPPARATPVTKRIAAAPAVSHRERLNGLNAVSRGRPMEYVQP